MSSPSSLSSATTTEESPPPPDSPIQYVHYHDGGKPGQRPILTGADAKPTFSAVPKIDMQRIYSPHLSDRQSLADEVGAACRDVGFFYAVNHGVDEGLLDSTFEAVEKYFDLPTDVKMECHNQKTEKFRGYEAFLEGKLDPGTRGGEFVPSFVSFVLPYPYAFLLA